MKAEPPPTRPYRQTARAKAAAETGERIIKAFIAQLQLRWFDEIRLEDVAADAKVTVQTVIRRFGGKEGLQEAVTLKMRHDILSARRFGTASPSKALDTIIAEYEERGDFILRTLAQEDRFPAIRRMTDVGRREHRAWVGQVFAPWLKPLPAAERREAHDMLVIALDLFTWKLVRVDMGRSIPTLRRIMLTMCGAALGMSADELQNASRERQGDANG